MRTFDTLEQAGTLHVAVQSVAPFDEEYIDQLQPHLDPADVTSATAIALTRVRQLEQLRDLLLQANVALQQTTISKTKTIKAGEVSDNTITETTTPPSLDKLPAAPTSTTGLPTPLTLPTGATPALDLATLLRAEVSLKQEVALLNRFVRDAAIARGTKPYVVRLLVTLTPAAHGEPYNAYATISLFTDSRETSLPQYVENEKGAHALLASAGSMCGKPVEVVPLFVTDNLESSLDNLAAQKNLGLSGAASGIVQNIGASVGANFRSQDLEQDQGHTLNALYTIGRLSADTIEARFGAPVAGSSYETLTRTYNVTVLALVPTAARYVDEHPKDEFLDFFRTSGGRQIANYIEPCREIVFASRSRFEDARTGKTLTSAFGDDRTGDLTVLANNWELGPESLSTLKNLYSYAQYQQFGKFREHVTELKREDVKTLPVQQTLWLDLISVTRRSGRSYGRFSLPVDDFEFFASNAKATVFDDGETASLTLLGGKRLTSIPIRATIEVDGGHTVPSSAINVAPDGRSATFVFPSPKKLLKNVPPHFLVVDVHGDRRRFDSFAFAWTHHLNDGSLTYLEVPQPDPPKPKIAMVVTAPHVIAGDDATGSFAVAFSSTDQKNPPNVRFAINGGYITDTSPATTADGADRVGAANATYVITVKNVAVGRKLTISAFNDTKGSRGKLIAEKSVDVIKEK